MCKGKYATTKRVLHIRQPIWDLSGFTSIGYVPKPCNHDKTDKGQDEREIDRFGLYP